MIMNLGNYAFYFSVTATHKMLLLKYKLPYISLQQIFHLQLEKSSCPYLGHFNSSTEEVTDKKSVLITNDPIITPTAVIYVRDNVVYRNRCLKKRKSEEL